MKTKPQTSKLEQELSNAKTLLRILRDDYARQVEKNAELIKKLQEINRIST